MKSKTRRDQNLLQSPIQFTVAFFCKLNLRPLKRFIGDTLLDILLMVMGLYQNEEKTCAVNKELEKVVLLAETRFSFWH